VAWYDFRNDVSGDTAATTDYWNRISSDGGATWAEQRVTASSFDMTTAPVAPASRGYFLGDYMGLASRGSAFSTQSVVTTGSTTNRTDVIHQSVSQP
jgi:hypothetical protein